VHAVEDGLLALAEELDLVGHAVGRDVAQQSLGERGVGTKRDQPLRRPAGADEHGAAAVEACADQPFDLARCFLI
jgi:hypothetical protein